MAAESKASGPLRLVAGPQTRVHSSLGEAGEGEQDLLGAVWHGDTIRPRRTAVNPSLSLLGALIR